MEPRLLALARRQGGVFTRAQALTVGHSAAEINTLVRTGLWCAVRRGVYTTRERKERASAGGHAARPRRGRGPVGHPRCRGEPCERGTAAGLAFLVPPEAVAELTYPRPRSPRSYPGLLVGHAELPPDHLARPLGLPATSAARTVVDIARRMEFRDAVVLADSALRLGRTDPAEMEAVLRHCHTWRGIRRAQRFATVAEIDGKVKYVPEPDRPDKGDRLWREKLRQERLADAGYQVVRITWWQPLNDPTGVAGRILAAFQRSIRSR